MLSSFMLKPWHITTIIAVLALTALGGFLLLRGNGPKIEVVGVTLGDKLPETPNGFFNLRYRNSGGRPATHLVKIFGSAIKPWPLSDADIDAAFLQMESQKFPDTGAAIPAGAPEQFDSVDIPPEPAGPDSVIYLLGTFRYQDGGKTLTTEYCGFEQHGAMQLCAHHNAAGLR